jgi:hypothetical protein
MFDKKDPRRWNKLAKVQFASPARFDHPAGAKSRPFTLTFERQNRKPGNNGKSEQPRQSTNDAIPASPETSRCFLEWHRGFSSFPLWILQHWQLQSLLQRLDGSFIASEVDVPMLWSGGLELPMLGNQMLLGVGSGHRGYQRRAESG